MIVCKPSWVRHGRHRDHIPINSLDVDPSGVRLATAGADGLVKVWSTAALLSSEAEADAGAPKLLGVLSHHTGQCHIVRWSPTGRLLASAGNECDVLLWELREGPPASTVKFGAPVSDGTPGAGGGEDGMAPIEHWAVAATCRGHTLEVTDVVWSPCGTRLCSGGLDGTVCVWDCTPASLGHSSALSSGSLLTRPLLVITAAHKGWVKGMAWDPVGRYLASFGEDKTVCVRQLFDVLPPGSSSRPPSAHTVATFTEPYAGLQNRSPIARSSWSPDGSLLCTSNGFVSPRMTAPVLARDDWAVAVSFVGHDLAVGATRFSPTLFKPKPDAAQLTDRGQSTNAVCAVGSADGSISVWITSSPNAVAVVKESFGLSVSDIAWHPNGHTLIASSLDGSTTLIDFEESVFGPGLTPLELEAHIRKLRGDYVTPAQVSKASTLESRLSGGAPTPTPLVLSGAEIAKAQVVTQTAGGKKRIRPVNLQPVEAMPQPPMSTPLSSFISPPPQASVQASPNASNRGFMTPPGDDGLKRPKTAVTAPPLQLAPINAEAPAPPPIVPKPVVTAAASAPFIPPPLLTGPTRCPPVHKLAFDTSVHSLLPSSTMTERFLELKDVPDVRGTSVACQSSSDLHWQRFIPSTVCVVASSGGVIALGCLDGSLELLSAEGISLAGTLILDGSVVSISCVSCNGNTFIVAITSTGAVMVWSVPSDAHQPKHCLTSSVAHLIKSMHSALPEIVSSAQLTNSVQYVSVIGPKSVLTVGLTVRRQAAVIQHTFCYDERMGAWARVADAAYSGSSFGTSSGTGILSQLPAVNAPPRSSTSTALLTQPITLSLCEHRLLAAKLLDSQDDYMHWLGLLVDAVCTSQDSARLRALCDELQAAGTSSILPTPGLVARSVLQAVVGKVLSTSPSPLHTIAESYQ